jgi:hypothetical protein
MKVNNSDYFKVYFLKDEINNYTYKKIDDDESFTNLLYEISELKIKYDNTWNIVNLFFKNYIRHKLQSNNNEYIDKSILITFFKLFLIQHIYFNFPIN